MLRERFTIATLMTLGISAIAVSVYSFNQASILVAAVAVFLSLFYTWSVLSKVKYLVDSMRIDKNLTGLSKIIQSISETALYKDVTIKKIISVLDKIGDDAQYNAEDQLDGEARAAIANLKAKLSAIKADETQRIWAAQGIASISEIRKNNSELTDYTFQIISYLIKYLNANQGAFYSIEESDQGPQLELRSTYAYGRRKYSNGKITVALGEGLTGQCVLERNMILMTDVPNDYVKITSGLGEATPRCIAIIPLIFRDQVFGVLEIASFQKLENYQVDFIKKACETIALELSGIKSQEHTRKLLEQSREEELRQNLEEMKATQREMQLKEEELSKQLITTKKAMALAESEQRKNEAILEGCMDAVISFNQDGYIEYFNKAAEEVFGFHRLEVIQQPIDKILNIRIVENEEGEYKILNNTGNEVSIRTEITATDSEAEELSLLLTATKVKIDKKQLFTLFAQKVSVDLF